MIIKSDIIYKKNNNTGTITPVVKLKEGNTPTLVDRETSWYDGGQYYKIILDDKEERFALCNEQFLKLTPNYICLGYREGNVYIIFYSGTATYPYLLNPIKETDTL